LERAGEEELLKSAYKRIHAKGLLWLLHLWTRAIPSCQTPSSSTNQRETLRSDLVNAQSSMTASFVDNRFFCSPSICVEQKSSD
jgi:hypothetical protein